MDSEISAIQKVIQAAALLLSDEVCKIIESDPHAWSDRPCPACRTVTALIGRPFGCEGRRDRYFARGDVIHTPMKAPMKNRTPRHEVPQ